MNGYKPSLPQQAQRIRQEIFLSNTPFRGSRRHLESFVFTIVLASLANLPLGNSIVFTIVFAPLGKMASRTPKSRIATTERTRANLFSYINFYTLSANVCSLHEFFRNRFPTFFFVFLKVPNNSQQLKDTYVCFILFCPGFDSFFFTSV